MLDMNPPAIVRSIVTTKSMQELAAEANEMVELGNENQRRSLAHYRKAGEILLKAKERCSRGEWLKWCKSNITSCGYQDAMNYIRIAENWEKVKDAGTLRKALKTIRQLEDTEGSRPRQRQETPAPVVRSKPVVIKDARMARQHVFDTVKRLHEELKAMLAEVKEYGLVVPELDNTFYATKNAFRPQP